MKNRNIFPRMGALVLVACLTSPTQAQVDIQTSSSTRQIQLVQTALEGRGVVQPEEKQTLRMSVDARFQYDERVIARTSQLKSIRHYDQAMAKITLDGKTLVNRLQPDKRIIIVQTPAADQPIKLASLGGPISQKEFELVQTPANTLILSDIFEKRGVKQGDTWAPDQQVLAQFLNIDSVDETDVKIELSALRDNVASLVIAGETTGTIDGAITQISLNGNVRFDLAAGCVAQASITLSQQRDIGLVAPGLDATFKILIRMQPGSDSEQLTDEGLASLRESSGHITDDLLLTPEGSPVSILHSRNWRVIADHSTRSILRYNQQGRMIGQCDVIPLPQRLSSQEQTLEQFRSVVKNKLTDSSGEVRTANQGTNRQGLDWMRVEASGASDSVNLVWIYYTINSPDGRRVQLVFTTEPAYAQAFAPIERYLVDSLSFTSEATESVAEKPANTKDVSYKKSASSRK